MATEKHHIQELIDKLETLPPERVAEVEDFIDFLKQRHLDRELVATVGKAAEGSFAQAWDNPDDAVYDSL